MKKYGIGVVLALSVLAIGLASHGIPLEVQAAEKVLKIRMGGGIAGIDPATIFQIENQSIALNVYNGLVKYNEKTNDIEPDLATSWNISGGGKVYTFNLRKGVKFHKGFGAFTAEDVKYSYDRVVKPETGSRYSGEFQNVVKTEILNPYKIRFTLKKAFNFLHKVAINQGHIVKKAAVEKFGDDYPLNPVGTGPFVFDKWIQGSEVHLVANKDYFEGPPKIDRVVMIVIKEETAAEIAFLNREIDIFWAMRSADVIKRLKKDSRVTVQARPANHTINFVLNTTYKPLGNKKVRQAIAHAINRKAIVEDFFQNLMGIARSAALTSNFPEYSDNVRQYKYDPERAKKLLAEAGYPQGFDLDVIGISLFPYSEIPVIIAEDLRKVGINPTIKIIERSAYGQARAKGEIQTAITGIVGGPDPDHPLWRLYHTSSYPPGMNTAQYGAIDSLLEEAQVEQDPKRRLKLYEQIQQQVVEDIPVIPLYEAFLYQAINNNVKGLELNSMATINFYPVSMD